MTRVKRYSAPVLLLIFAIGGVGGPLLHRVQHGVENSSASGAVHDHAHPVDGTDTLTKVASDGLVTLDCVLCASLVYQVGLEPALSTTLPAVAGVAAAQLFEHTSLLKSPDRARAPPVCS